MRIRRFEGRNSAEAIAAVRRSLGDDALILETGDEDGRVMVTAAVDPDFAGARSEEPRPAGGLDAELRRIGRGLARIERELFVAEARTEPSTEERLCYQAHGTNARVLALVGPTGAGKTLTLAKLAAQSALRGERAAWITLDDMRLGARAEAETWGEALGIPVFAPADPAALRRVVGGLADFDRVLLDTPGMHGGVDALDTTLQQLAGVSEPVACLAVLSATGECGFVRRAWERLAASSPVGAVVTHLDEVDDVRPMLEACASLEMPLAWLASGQRIAGDLERATAQSVAAWLAA